jgi:hypothetical protein
MADLTTYYTGAFGEPTRNLFESQEYRFADPAQQRLAYEQALASGTLDPSSGGLSVAQRVEARNAMEGRAEGMKLGREQKALDLGAQLYQQGLTNPHELRSTVLEATGTDILKTRMPFNFNAAETQRQNAAMTNALKQADYLSQFLPPERVVSEVQRLTGVDLSGRLASTPNLLKRMEAEAGLKKTRAETAGIAAREQETLADVAKKEQERKEAPVVDFSAIETARFGLDAMRATAQELRDAPGLWRAAGPVASRLPTASADTADIEAKMKNLTSNIALRTLSQIRAESKTGGALGNVSNYDVQLLENAVANLTLAQSPESVRKALDKVIAYTDNVRKQADTAYAGKYLPQAARAELKRQGEGVPVQFGNGQVWRMERGVPVRVR